MKICWDNLENIRLTQNNNFRDVVKGETYYYIENCENCGDSFLKTISSKGIFCDCYCRDNYHSRKMTGKNNPMYGKTGKLNPMFGVYGKSHQLYGRTGKESTNWKGGYYSDNIPAYDTYAHQIKWAEEVGRNKADKNILEVKCTYCGKWYIPGINSIKNRIGYLNGNYSGENRLYCSDECKQECPVYNQKFWPRGFKISTSREVQPELRQMVFERDEYTCQKCGSTKSLHCHHLEGILWEPLQSADVDMCVTLCKQCHKKVHKLSDCWYNDLKCNKEI